MKLERATEFHTWNLKEISSHYGVTLSTLTYRCNRLGLKKTLINGYYEFRLNVIDIDKVINFNSINRTAVEVIYVTRTIEIYESKLNHKQLSEL